MNLPNKLTLFRVILVPFFVAVLLIGYEYESQICNIIALIIYVVASITDLFDGMIARKENLVTNFGKFADPLADKLLVCSAFICLSYMDRIPVWITVVVVAREFVVSGIRLIAVEEGKVIPASMWGKLKTFESMVMLAVVILNFDFTWWQIIQQILIYFSLILTVVSMIDYIVKNKGVFERID